MSSPLWTDVAQVVLVGLQLVVLIVAAVVAWRQVQEARTLREEQNRPFVVMDFDVDDPWIFVTVTNLGTSLARDVSFEITPPLQSSLDDTPELTMITNGIRTLPPNKVYKTFWDGFIQRSDTDLPDHYGVVVSYTDEKGKRKFSEPLDLDLGIYKGFSVLVRKDIHHVHEILKSIHGEMKKWTAGSRGLAVLSPDEISERNERGRREMEMRRAAMEEAERQGIDAPPGQPNP